MQGSAIETTFMAPFVAITLREIPIKNAHKQHKNTSTRLCQSPTILTIWSNYPNECSSKPKGLCNMILTQNLHTCFKIINL